jgi:hypothetical protein
LRELPLKKFVCGDDTQLAGHQKLSMVPEIMNKAICLNFAGYKNTNGFVNSLKGEKIVNGG